MRIYRSYKLVILPKNGGHCVAPPAVGAKRVHCLPLSPEGSFWPFIYSWEKIERLISYKYYKPKMSRIVLNIGGQVFETTVETALSISLSMISSLTFS